MTKTMPANRKKERGLKNESVTDLVSGRAGIGHATETETGGGGTCHVTDMEVAVGGKGHVIEVKTDPGSGIGAGIEIGIGTDRGRREKEGAKGRATEAVTSEREPVVGTGILTGIAPVLFVLIFSAVGASGTIAGRTF
jgi:hypothetical protein